MTALFAAGMEAARHQGGPVQIEVSTMHTPAWELEVSPVYLAAADARTAS